MIRLAVEFIAILFLPQTTFLPIGNGDNRQCYPGFEAMGLGACFGMRGIESENPSRLVSDSPPRQRLG